MPPPSFSGTSSSSTFGIPGSNLTNFGAVDWTNIVSVPAGHFIYAVMTGNVTATGDNPECEGRDAGTYPPNGIPGSSAFVASLRLSGGSGGQVRSSDSLWIAGGPNSADGAILQAERDGGGANCSPGGHGLSLSSAQSIAYEIHPAADVTQSPAMTSPGDTITYTANSYWTWENIRWLWQPNDTTATPKGTRWAYERCRDTMVCSHAPTKSGRMYFTGTIKGANATVRAPISWVGTPADLPTPQVTLSCSPQTVVRGGNVTCTFDVGDTGPVDSISEVTWRFDADSSKVFPAEPPAVWGSQRLKIDSVRTSWVGRMVLGGTVTVTVSRAGKAASAQAPVNVTDRSGPPWSDTPATLTTLSRLAYTDYGYIFAHHLPNDTGQSSLAAGMFAGGVTVDTVTGGPNAGFAWVSSVDLESPWGVQYNEWVLQDGPEVIPAGSDSVNNWTNVLIEVSPDSTEYSLPAEFLADIEDHEVGGHHGRLVAELGTLGTCGNANGLLERLAGDPSAVSPQTVTEILMQSRHSTLYAKSHYFVYEDVGPRVYTTQQAPWAVLYRRNLHPPRDTNETWEGNPALCQQP